MSVVRLRPRRIARRQPRALLQVAIGATLLGLATLAGCEDPAPRDSTGPLPSGSDRFRGQVTRIVDGDTFWVDSQPVSIRVWGLDAPERGTAAGPAATATLSGLIRGATLTCRERDIDRYGRIVGQCSLPDGRDIAAAMITSGTATEYCRYSGGYYGTC